MVDRVAFFMVIPGPCERFSNPYHYPLLAHSVSCVLTNTITLNDFGAISGERGFSPWWDTLGSNGRWCVRKGKLRDGSWGSLCSWGQEGDLSGCASDV